MADDRDDGIDEYAGYLAAKYPWFSAANMVVSSNEEPPVNIALTYDFRPAAQEGDVRGLFVRDAPARLDTDTAITRGDKADDSSKGCSGCPVSADGDVLGAIPESGPCDDSDDELATEELAAIYMEQEYFDEALKIYGRLSLLYPEKSIYFAEIIGRAKALEAAKEEF